VVASIEMMMMMMYTSGTRAVILYTIQGVWLYILHSMLFLSFSPHFCGGERQSFLRKMSGLSIVGREEYLGEEARNSSGLSELAGLERPGADLNEGSEYLYGMGLSPLSCTCESFCSPPPSWLVFGAGAVLARAGLLLVAELLSLLLS